MIKRLMIIVLLAILCSTALAATYQYDDLNRLSKVVYEDGIKIVYTYDASGNRSQKVITPLSDLDLDGGVNLIDFATLAAQWLDAPGEPSADIAPWPNSDDVVDFKDLAKFAEQWLAGVQ